MGSDILTKRKIILERETINSTFDAAVTFTRCQDDRKCGECNIKVFQYGYCSRQGNHLFFRCSDAGCVYTPSKNVKNTEGRKVPFYLQFCFK